MHTQTSGVALLLVVLFVATFVPQAAAIDEQLRRGQALHDSICRGCHEDDTYKDRHLSHNPYFDLRTQSKLWREFVKVK